MPRYEEKQRTASGVFGKVLFWFLWEVLLRPLEEGGWRQINLMIDENVVKGGLET